MGLRLPDPLRQAILRWSDRRMGHQGTAVRLPARGIYILPTGTGMAYALLVVALWLAAVNYSSNLGHALAFLLVGIGLSAMLATWRNLAGVVVAKGGEDSVFAGGVARFRVQLADREGRPRSDISLVGGTATGAPADVPAFGQGEAWLDGPAPRRGWLRPGRFTVATRYPGGLFRAWAWLDPDWSVLIYPRPEGGRVPDPAAFLAPARGGEHGTGDEDFRGLRRYQAGDPPRHVAWRLYARGQELHTKQFAGQAPGRIWLDWQMLAGMAHEARIARLARWVLDAERAGRDYGLRLPETEIPPGHGGHHRHLCLRALAVMAP